MPPPPVADLLHRAAELAVPTACLACRAPAGRAGEPLCPACRRARPWLRDGPRAAVARGGTGRSSAAGAHG